jgi:ornithine cyclodeaminase/alanine dehydrogenase-like protein (mu-crystallin family)
MSALLLTRSDVARLMAPGDYLAAVETAFRLNKLGKAPSPPPMHLPGQGGGFHAKGAALYRDRQVVALKFNGNFPGNLQRQLPTIQGVILLCDAAIGTLLAVIDSIEITLQRTAAASALAAKHLARPDASVLAVCGCGAQARAQAIALAAVRKLESGVAWDVDHRKAETFAAEMRKVLGIRFGALAKLDDAARSADIIVTCTTARSPFLAEDDVSRGVFIAAVGADSPEKSEIAPSLMARATVVADNVDQCLAMGDLHHAVAAGMMTATEVHGDLGDILIGAKPGRTDVDEIIVFDSTGTAIQDVASAALVFERAAAAGIGTSFDFAAPPLTNGG